MIVERLMAAGDWTLELRADTPQRVLDYTDPATYGYSTVVVTDTRIDSAAVNAATLRTLARWSGVFRRRDGLTLSGAGLAVLLGDEDDKGPIVDTAVTASGATLATVLGDLLPRNGIDVGTVTTTSLNTITATFQYVTVRQAIAAACEAAGAEYRINPALTVDAAVPGTLFTSYTTPSAIVTRHNAARSGTPFGIQPVDLGVEVHVEDYTTAVFYAARDSANDTVSVATATAVSVPFKHPGGSDLEMERFIDSAGAAPADATNLAAAQLGRFDSATRGVSLTTDEHDLPARVAVGDQLYVYDPWLGLIDTANKVERGVEVLCPVAVRVLAMSWPVRRGMGVYLLTSEATSTVVDLSDYVVAEEQTATLEVGVAPRSIVGGSSTATLSPFGSLPIASVVAGFRTPGLGGSPTYGTGGNFYRGATYSIDPSGVVFEQGRVRFGTSGFVAGSGALTIDVPVPIAITDPPSPRCGIVTMYDSSTGNVAGPLLAVPVDTNTMGISYPASWLTGSLTNASWTAPFTLAASDAIEWQFTYRRA